MPQHDLDIANGSGAAVRGDINAALLALGTTMRGPNPPPSPQAGMLWLEDDNPSTTNWTLRLFDGVDWITVGVFDTAGNQFSPAGVSIGLVNLIDNAGMLVNQRGYVSGTPVAAPNTYTLDRWRVVTSGQALSWIDSGGLRVATAPAGGVEQVIEGSRIAPSDYVLSWTGTAAATVNGNSVLPGGVVTLAGGANATVRFSNGTFTPPQLQRGRVGTPFEWRHQAVETAICQRYCYVLPSAIRISSVMVNTIGHLFEQYVGFPMRMRVTPTASAVAFSAGIGNLTQAVEVMGPDGFRLTCNANGSGTGIATITLNAGATFSADF